MEKLKAKVRKGKKLTENEQIELCKLGNEELIELYCRKHCLLREAEKELIRQGNLVLLQRYIDKFFYFYAENAADIVKIASKEFIKYYINRFYLCEKAQKDLVELGDDELIRLYEERWWKIKEG